MTGEEAPFVPTVTAISSTPDFQWMVQPTIITSVSPSLGSKQANEPQSSHQATPKEGGNKGKNAAKKGKAEQVGWSGSPLPDGGQSSLLCTFRVLYFSCISPAVPCAFHRLSIYIQVTPSLQQWSIFRSIAEKHAFAIFQRLCW